MKKNSGDVYVRADEIDLKGLDEHLHKFMNHAFLFEKKMKNDEEEKEPNINLIKEEMMKKKCNGFFIKADQRFINHGFVLEKNMKNKNDEEDEEPSNKTEYREIDTSKLIIEKAIARLTFDTVYKGLYNGQDVAVKMLDWGKEEGQRKEDEIATLKAAFTKEVAVWHNLDHPNITKYIGATMGKSELNIATDEGLISMESNICCIIIEYLPKGTLKSYLIKNDETKLPFRLVVQLALDIARGLSYLHSKKIVHRDVKTENMYLDKANTVKIADFGVARFDAENLNEMTGMTGTLGYMAPEVINGNPYDRKCDVYSFAICLWEIYCCDMPYGDIDFSELTSAVVQKNLRPEIPRCCPSSLANVMKRCWAANPEKRPEMDEVVILLEAIDTSKGGGMIPLDQQPRGCLCLRRYRGP